jgi:5-methylcytosine-specific restriction endonuclease McrA
MVRDAFADHYPTQAGACPLSRWQGAADRCRWCDRPARESSPWCATACEDEYRTNHWWDLARHAVLSRDDHRCRVCGLGPDTVTVAKLTLRALIPMSPVEAARLWRTEAWWALELACSVEVNHREPRLGGGYASGCHHHLDGLETLCHRCHLAVTAAQRTDRRADRQAAG